MAGEGKNTNKGSYFNLSDEDRMELELKRKEKEEKEIAAEKVMKKVKEKFMDE